LSVSEAAADDDAVAVRDAYGFACAHEVFHRGAPFFARAPAVAPAWRTDDSTSSIAASSERTGASAGVTSPISVRTARRTVVSPVDQEELGSLER